MIGVSVAGVRKLIEKAASCATNEPEKAEALLKRTLDSIGRLKRATAAQRAELEIDAVLLRSGLAPAAGREEAAEADYLRACALADEFAHLRDQYSEALLGALAQIVGEGGEKGLTEQMSRLLVPHCGWPEVLESFQVVWHSSEPEAAAVAIRLAVDAWLATVERPAPQLVRLTQALLQLSHDLEPRGKLEAAVELTGAAVEVVA